MPLESCQKYTATLSEILALTPVVQTIADATDVPGVRLEWMNGAWYGDCGFPSAAQHSALIASNAYNSLGVGSRATLPSGPVTWRGAVAGWVATSAPTSNASTTGAITVQRGGVIKFGTLTNNVTFALSSGSDEAHWIFATGATPPTITWPTGITWSIAAPTISANKTYEISVLDNLALWISF